MTQWVIILKNYTGTEFIIEDLGFPISDSTADIEIYKYFTYDEISGSDNLRSLVNDGDLIINNGIEDLIPEEGINYLTLIHKSYLEENYYNKSYIDTVVADKNTLNEAYNEGGPGTGRIINAISGPVKIDVGVATNSPFELTEKLSLPTTGLSSGQLAVKDGILFLYDGSRSKWISVSRKFISFGRKGLSRNQFLNIYCGEIPSNLSGIDILRDAVILSIGGRFDVSGTGTFQIRKNDEVSPIVSLSLSGVTHLENLSVNVDLNSGDGLQGYLLNTFPCKDPVVILEIAWRG